MNYSSDQLDTANKQSELTELNSTEVRDERAYVDKREPVANYIPFFTL